MTTDESLYYNFLNGDESGLGELMERYGSRLTLYINGYIKDIHYAEDLMIEAFAYIFTKKPKIKEGCLHAYLYKSARHLALRHAEKSRRKKCFSFDELNAEPESAAIVEDIIQTREQKRILNLCMNELNADYREALYLVYFENMHHKEAAEVMKKSEKQIADLIYRGKQSLKMLLKRKGVTHA